MVAALDALIAYFCFLTSLFCHFYCLFLLSFAVVVAVAAETTSDCRHHSKSDDRPGRQHAERPRTATRRDLHSTISRITHRKRNTCHQYHQWPDTWCRRHLHRLDWRFVAAVAAALTAL